MTKTEAERLATAVAALRPDWPTKSVLTFLATNLAEKPYRDTAVALVWVAADPQSQTPARVLEPGVWWRAAAAASPTPGPVRHECAEHPGQRAWCCTQCAQTATPPDPDTLATMRATIRAADRPERAVQHPTPPTDLTQARHRADQEQNA